MRRAVGVALVFAAGAASYATAHEIASEEAPAAASVVERPVRFAPIELELPAAAATVHAVRLPTPTPAPTSSPSVATRAPDPTPQPPADDDPLTIIEDPR